ncbi:MAG: PAS domain-containing protein [Vicinamibacterales bacterium]
MPPDPTPLDARLEALLSMPHVLVLVLDPDGRVRHLNRAVEVLVARAAAAVRDVPFRELIHAADHPQLDSWLDALRQTGEQPGHLEVRVAVPGDVDRWVSWSAAADRHHHELLVFGKDVSARRGSESRAAEVGRRLAEAQHIARIGSWTWDVASDRTTWSEEMYWLVGLDPSMPAPRYEDHPTLYTADSWARLRQAVAAAVERGLPYQIDLERRLPDGGTRAYVARGEPERGADGRVARISGTLQDVTDLRAAERARYQTEQRLHHLAAQVPGCIYEYRVFPDGTSRFVYMSEGVRELLGVDPEAVCADVDAIRAAILEEDREPMERSIAESVASMREWRHEFRVRRPDGELRIIRGQSRPRRLADGTVVKSGQLTDVTGLQRVARLLDETQRTASVGGWEADLVTGRLYWTDEMFRIFGVAGPSPPALADALDLLGPAHASRARAQLAAGEDIDEEILVTGGDGEPRWVRFKGRSERAGGRVIRTYGSAQDITALKASEIALRESEARLRALNAQIPGVLYDYWVAPDGRDGLHYISDGCREIFGVAPEAALADMSRIWALVHPDDVPVMRQTMAESARTGTPWRYEFRVQRPGHDTRYLRAHAVPRVSADGLTVWAGKLSDVTEEQRVARLLEQTQEATGVGGWEVQLPSMRLFWTDETFRIHELPVGAPPDVGGAIAFYAPEARAVMSAAVDRAIATGEGWDLELPFTTARGRERWVRAVGKAHVREGRAVSLYGSIQDITEVKHKEQELVAAREAALDASRAKSRFLANMSHEIRTPMNGVLGMADLALESCESDEQREFLQVIYDSGHHLLGILNDVLDLAKVEARKIDIEHRPFDLAALMAETARPFSAQATRRGLRFDVRLAGAPPRVVGDSLRVAQVVRNLLSNAFKFTTAGSVTLSVSADRDGATEIAVADTGTGIPADRASRLFEPFTQGDESTARQYGGTGLGLAISNELVGLMGGSIGVESEVGRGSTFRVRLPLPSAEALPATLRAGDPQAGERPQLGLRVLVAEDNPVNARVASLMLTRLGCRATIAASGHAALEALGRASYDVALLDLDMPGLGGLDVARRIRDGEREGGHLPLVALTADAMQGTEARCLEAGMDGYLTKPIGLGPLAGTLARLVPESAH